MKPSETAIAMKHCHEAAVATARELIELFRPLESAKLECIRYQKVVKFSLKRLFG